MRQKRKGLNPKLRFEVLARDGFACQYCGARAPVARLQVDHIDPVDAGGSDDPLNLITSCWECNIGKGANPGLVRYSPAAPPSIGDVVFYGTGESRSVGVLASGPIEDEYGEMLVTIHGGSFETARRYDRITGTYTFSHIVERVQYSTISQAPTVFVAGRWVHGKAPVGAWYVRPDPDPDCPQVSMWHWEMETGGDIDGFQGGIARSYEHARFAIEARRDRMQVAWVSGRQELLQ